MTFLSLCRRLWNIARPRGQTPFGVRAYFYSHLYSAFLIVYYANLPWQNDLGIWGINFGVCGAGTLFWEASAHNNAFLGLAMDVMDYPPSAFLQKCNNILKWVVVLYVALTYLATYLGSAKIAGDGHWYDIEIIRYIARLIAVVLIPSAIVFALFWVPDKLFKWLAKKVEARSSGLAPYVKRGLRRIGFVLLWLAGAFQLPILICPPG
jgi:hypothetical protein